MISRFLFQLEVEVSNEKWEDASQMNHIPPDCLHQEAKHKTVIGRIVNSIIEGPLRFCAQQPEE